MLDNKNVTSDFMKKAYWFLRISNELPEIDIEIKTLIMACQNDLLKNGIDKKMVLNIEDGLIQMAILFYLKAEFGLDNKNHDRYRESYELLRTELSLTDIYLSGGSSNVG